MSEPLKVNISPKAMSTEWCISPIGGQRKPHASNAHPKMRRSHESPLVSFPLYRGMYIY